MHHNQAEHTMNPETDETTWEPKSLNDAERLYDVAHSRSGDKGNKNNVVVVPFEDEIYDDLVDILTAERVAEHFDGLFEGDIDRYCVPSVSCINFVLHDALDGGVTKSLRMDPHGKTYSRHMLLFPL